MDENLQHVAFIEELAELVNKYNRPEFYNTPSYFLALYVDGTLESLGNLINNRDRWMKAGHKSL